MTCDNPSHGLDASFDAAALVPEARRGYAGSYRDAPRPEAKPLRALFYLHGGGHGWRL